MRIGATRRRSAIAVALIGAAVAPLRAEPGHEQHIAPPVFTMPDSIWRGFHVGLNFGGGFTGPSHVTGIRTGEAAIWSKPFPQASGVLGGVQAGYDFPFGNVVVGVEADWQAAGMSNGALALGAGAEPGALLDARRAIDWFGTLRGRIGYTVAPQFLVYATGGFAYGGGGVTSRYLDAAAREGEGITNPVRAGFSVGGGLEWAFLPNWSAKLEYLYVNLGRTTGHAMRLEGEEEEPALPVFAAVAGHSIDFHAFRAGVNYRFKLIGDAEADSHPEELTELEGDKSPEISTHYIFGFTYGTDIETEGKGELLSITRMDLAKRGPATPTSDPASLAKLAQGASDYRAITETLEFEHTLTDRLQYALGVIGANHHSRGVQFIEDIDSTSLRGVLGELRYILLRRGKDAPFGLALHVEPRWGHVSGVTGRAETAVESDTRLMIDAAPIPGKLFTALNVIYQPQLVRELGEPQWLKRSSFGLFGAFTYFVNPKVAIGGNAQYLRAYSDGFGLNKFDGDALYVGPQAYVRLTDRLFFTGSYAAQVAGHSRLDSRPLDLVNFTRHTVRLQFGGEF